MSRIQVINTLAVITVLMALFQAPFFYYYTYGLVVFLILLPYMLVGFLLTIILFILIMNSTNKEKLAFSIVCLLLAVGLGTTSLFAEDLMEEWDWKFRKSAREEIVQQVKLRKLTPNVSHNDIICSLNGWGFPPVSNGGNEIGIYRGGKQQVTVEFYINRGFLDNYSAFVYTDDPVKIIELEERITQKYGNHINRKLAQNWYRVSY